MILFLACLFVVAVAIGSYIAVSVAAAMLHGDHERGAVGSPHTRL
jgi:hypothetical protein